jgi:vesicle-fusing ATPase
LQEVELFRDARERKAAIAQLQEAGFAMRSDDEDGTPLQIGIKKLLTVVEMARQEPDNVSQRLTSALMGLGM